MAIRGGEASTGVLVLCQRDPKSPGKALTRPLVCTEELLKEHALGM
jgi:hypothetical protein